MNEDRDIVLRIDRKAGILLAVLLAAAWGGAALSEQLTLTTSYPVPSGIYNQLVTTGNSGSTAADTILNRNAGNTILVPPTNASGRVGIGTASPASKLDVSGIAGVTNLQVNGVATANAACSPNGLVARDSVGKLLSCQLGVWKNASASDDLSCPSGMTLIPAGVGFRSFCISSAGVNTGNRFSVAQWTCNGAVGRRVCSPAQWFNACSSSLVPGLAGEVDYVGEAEAWDNCSSAYGCAMQRGGSGCSSTNWVPAISPGFVRCCTD